MNSTQVSSYPYIRYATPNDMDRIMEIEQLCFQDQWQNHQFVAALKDLFFVFEKNEILGFLIACPCGISRRAIIMRIAVHPDHWGQGIASKLIEAALEKIKQTGFKCVELDVDIVKNGAIKLYEKFGFKVMKVVTVNYDEEMSFYIMKLLFPGSNRQGQKG